MNGLSIIIPIQNKAKTVEVLAKRLTEIFNFIQIPYELIFIDEQSNDGTAQILFSLSQFYPLSIYLKNGKKGKAASSLQGVSVARYDTVVFLDSNLDFSSELIVRMLQKIQNGSDMVIANRSDHSRFITKWFHSLDIDRSSPLKILRKEIAERLPIQFLDTKFDLELMIKARDAGYRIDSVDMKDVSNTLSKKKNSLSEFLSTIADSLNLAWMDPQVIPYHPETERKKGKGFHFKGVEFLHYNEIHHTESAFHRLSNPQIIVLLTIGILFVLGLFLDWHSSLTIIIASLTVVYFADLLFNFFLIYRSYSKPPEVRITDEEIKQANDRIWPTYTILCPLYKEWRVLPQFVDALSKLDYPTDKLQVMLLLEEDDVETIQQAQNTVLPEQFSIQVVPHSLPKTKPKALNFGLRFATGEYTVIYDAEDIPDPLQLKKAVLAFERSNKRIKCIQAKLDFYNPHQNVLTKIFTAEYSLWFDLVLTGLQSIHAPIPLGGTSNHFRTQDLRELKGWDAFNVTEDCDLGMRLVKKGYQTAIIDSITHEEANSDLRNWFSQRTRWIKGYIQSYFVHMRNPGEFLKNWREPHVITFQLVVGGKVLSTLINPLMWALTIIYFVFRPVVGTFIESFFPTPVLYMAVISLIIGNFLYMYYYMIGCAKREYDDIVKYALLTPFYWLAMSLAAYVAVYRMIRTPHYWSKTKHGLHFNQKKEVNSAENIVENKLMKPSLVLSATYAEKTI